MADLAIPDGFAPVDPGLPAPPGFSAQPYSGTILPVTKDAQGNVAFDSNAGVVGMAKRLFSQGVSAASAPADILSGKLPIMGADGEYNPEMINRAIDFGTLFSPQSVASRAGELVPGALSVERAPGTRQLKSAASAGYDAARASNATVPGDAIADMSRQLQQSLQGDHGIIAKTAPKTYAILDELASPQTGAFGTYPGLEAARRGLSTIASEGGTEGFAASKAIPGLNSFIDSVAPQAADARANYAAAMRSNSLTGELDRANTGILERAEARSEATHSGRNLDNAIRQRVASLLEKPSEVSGFSAPEIDALKAVIAGGPAQNSARFVGNLLGGGGGLGHTVTAMAGGLGGAHLGGGALDMALGAALPPAIGYGAKSLENMLSRRLLNSADETVRMNSPLARAMAAQGLLSVPAMGRNSAVLRSVLPGLLAPSIPQGQPIPAGLLDGWS